MDNSHVPTHEADQTELTQPISSRFPITNGLLRRFQPSSPPRPVDTTNYRECLRNHAAGLGGLALDGCGGYIAPPNSSESDPTHMKCMVCSCHRNYHRMENDYPPAPENRYVHPTLHHQFLPAPPQPPAHAGQMISPSYYPPPQRMVLNVSEDNMIQLSGAVEGAGGSKRRKRTKFSREQKVRMQEIAEKLEWKMKRGEDEMIEVFCSEVGIQRNVFKVWMHNNKCILGKRNAAGDRVDHNQQEKEEDTTTRDREDLQLQLQLQLQIVEGNECVVANENVANVSSSSSDQIN